MRNNKGRSLITQETDYVCIDLETAGFGELSNTIIELAAVKVQNNFIVDSFSSLVNPMCEISEVITDLTGITNEMLTDAPAIEDVLPEYLKFIGNSIVVGHNVNTFDVNIIYDTAERLELGSFVNDFIDTLTFSRKVLKDLNKHSLKDVAKELGVSYSGAHRALADCNITYQCYERLKDLATDIPGIFTDKPEMDKDNPLYGKTCVVAGSVKGYTQAAVMNRISDLGGICKKDLNSDIDFLIIGEVKTEKAQLALKRAQELGIAIISADNLQGLENYNSKNADTFGCCHLFETCSDARKCLHRDLEYAKGCAYRKNLEAGRIFYGVNAIN